MKTHKLPRDLDLFSLNIASCAIMQGTQYIIYQVSAA